MCQKACFGDVRVQFMMIGGYTRTHTHTRTRRNASPHYHPQLNKHTHKATEARPDKQIIWRRHYSLYECNNWFHYLVRISATLNEALDSVLVSQDGLKLCAGLAHHGPVFTLCFSFFFFGALSRITAEQGCVCSCFYLFKGGVSVKEFSVGSILCVCAHVCIFFSLFIFWSQPVWACPPLCKCIFSLSGKQWWAGREEGRPTLTVFWRR